jgi:hypothetical protein
MKYTPREDALIIKHYPADGAGGMHRAGYLLHRTRHSIKARARDLGVRHHQWAIVAPQKPARWWDYPVTVGFAPRAVLA